MSDLDVMKICSICDIEFEPRKIEFEELEIKITFHKLVNSTLVLSSEFKTYMLWKNPIGTPIALDFNKETQKKVLNFIRQKLGEKG